MVNKNILVFGSPACGKSTLIKEMSCNNNNKYYFYKYVSQCDDEGKPKSGNFRQLTEFIDKWGKPVLVIFLFRRGRIFHHDVENWNFLIKVIGTKTPIVCVVNHCEQNEDGNLDSWWKSNLSTFHGNGIVPTKFVGTSFCHGNKIIGDPYVDTRKESCNALLSTIEEILNT
jgi:hypothetical protein